MSSKAKEKQIKELSDHILKFQESIGNYWSLMKQLNDLKEKKSNLELIEYVKSKKEILKDEPNN